MQVNVPGESTGRFLDALTDAIRPFTEKRGLAADQIRLQREDVLLRIAIKARAKKKVELGESLPVPDKFLVPFLERASLEGADDNMIEWWASLLASAAANKENQKPIYIDIMATLTVEEAEFLERLWAQRVSQGSDWVVWGATTARDLCDELCKRIHTAGGFDDESWVDKLRSMLIAQHGEWADRGCLIECLSYPGGRGNESLVFPSILGRGLN